MQMCWNCDLGFLERGSASLNSHQRFSATDNLNSARRDAHTKIGNKRKKLQTVTQNVI
jgi:hypothetical protein